MGLETATYISDLVPTNPVGGTDPKSQGDEHIRTIKAALLATFPSINGAVSATDEELSALHVPADGTAGIAYGANWSKYGGLATSAKLKKLTSDLVIFGGTFKAAGAASLVGAITLPAGYRPSQADAQAGVAYFYDASAVVLYRALATVDITGIIAFGTLLGDPLIGVTPAVNDLIYIPNFVFTLTP
jgi:hypothetical protein